MWGLWWTKWHWDRQVCLRVLRFFPVNTVPPWLSTILYNEVQRHLLMPLTWIWRSILYCPPCMTRFYKWSPFFRFSDKNFSPMCHTYLAYLPLLDLIILLKSSEKYKYEAPQYVIFSILYLLPLLGPHNLLITLFSNTLFNLCCSFDVRDSIPRVGIYIVLKIKYREPVVI
jgi:hypothetical protein